MPEAVDREHQQRQLTHPPRIDHAQAIDRAVRRQGQQHQRRCCEQHHVEHLALGERAADETVQRLAQQQRQRHHHADGRGQRRLHRGIRAEQIGREQRHLAGDAGVDATAAPVGDDDQRTDEHRACRDQQQTRELHRERARQRHDGVGAQTAGHAHRGIALAPFALETDQQPDAERDGKTCGR